LRHPLACAHYQWGKWVHQRKGKQDQLDQLKNDCGERYIQHWLQLQRTLFLTDGPSLRRLLVVPFELFLGEGMNPPLSLEASERATQGMTNGLFEFLGLEPSVRLEFTAPDGENEESSSRRRRRSKPQGGSNDDDDDDGDDDDDDGGRRGQSRRDTDGNRRRLLEYHGSWHHLRLQHGSVFAWVKEWQEQVDMNSKSCRRVVAFYEDEVQKFGYSLANLTRVTIPDVVRRHMKES